MNGPLSDILFLLFSPNVELDYLKMYKDRIKKICDKFCFPVKELKNTWCNHNQIRFQKGFDSFLQLTGKCAVRMRGDSSGKARVSVQGVELLWGDCRFIPADWS